MERHDRQRRLSGLFLSLMAVLAIAIAVLTVTTVLSAPAHAEPHVTGQWTTLPYLMPLNPIHAAVLKNGKVLIVAGSENDPTTTSYKAAVWDPVAGTFSEQTTPWDLFCNGLSFLPDGRVLITGGNLDKINPYPGPPWTTIFDPATEQFYRVEDMAKGRWYPSNAALSDGGTMVFGGLDEQTKNNNTVEIYDVGGGWSAPYQASWSTGWYPRMHLLGNGKVFVGAPNPESRTFDPASGTWSSFGSKTNYGLDRKYGSSVLLPLGIDDGYRPRVVLFGGDTSTATNTVEMIDLGVWPEAWVNVPPMSVARVHPNAVLLPNGKILVLGGSSAHLDLATAHLNAEIFDPISQTWTAAGTMAYPRIYHHTALLLPDATVYVGGSNPGREIWEPHIEVYAPPYLFTSTGAPAPRPTISALPAIVGYGQAFAVTTPDAAGISQVLLMRPGANSHAFDMEQRLVSMQFTKGSGAVTAFAPTSAGAAPPGFYMLFIVDAQGVPSVGKFIQISPNPANQPPTATITSPAGDVAIMAGESVTFAGTASDPDGSIALYAWVFPGGSPAKSNAQNPGAVTFATPGVSTVSFTVLDNEGVNNPSPPTVTITVGGTPQLGASIASPVSGSTVDGIVTVDMVATNAQGSPTQFVLKLDDTTTLSNQTITSGSTATYSWNTAGVPPGEHALNLTVTDGAGRIATAVANVSVSSGDDPPPPPPGPDPQPVVWTSAVKVAVDGNSITKNAGCNGCADAGAVSQQTIAAGNGYVEFTVSPGAALTAGLSTGNPGTSGGEIKFALRFGSTYVEVRESGVYKADWSLVAGAVHKVAVEEGAVKYYQDGVLKYASAQAPTYPLLVDSAIFTVGAGIQNAVISTGSGAETSPPDTPPTVAIAEPANGATVSGSTVTVSATASDDGGVASVQFQLDGANLGPADTAAPYAITWNTTTTADGTHALTAVATDTSGNTTTSAPVTVTVANGDVTPPAVAITAPADGATVSGTAVAVSATASDDVGVASVQFQLDGANLGPADTAAPYAIPWDTTTATPGTHTLTAVAKDAAGNVTTSAPITVTVSNDGPGPGPQPVVWTSAVNVAVDGNTITKNAGCNGCADAGAISEQTIPSGSGSVSFTVSSGAQMTVGLSAGNGGTGGAEIKFGLRFYPGSPGYVEVRESGVYKWDFANVAGAVHKVAVDAGVVKYYQNDTLKYTSTGSPTYPLLVDTSLNALGSAVQNAVIGP